MTDRVDDYRDAIERAFESSDAIDEVPIEEFSRVLSVPRRIAELLCILEADESLSVDAIVDHLAETGIVDHDADDLSILLYHCDLPLLAETGLVSVDFDRGRVTHTSTGSKIASALSIRSVGFA